MPAIALPRRALLAVWIAVAVGVLPGIARATALSPTGQDWEGLSQLVALVQAELGPKRVVVTPRLDLHALKRDDAVFLVHPTRPLDVDELTAFMTSGGRVLLLDDFGTGDELLSRFGIRRVPLPAHPAEMLRGNPALAIAEPASEHAAVRGVGRVVTNHATGLDHKALSSVLVVRGEGEPDVLLAIAGTVGRGRLLAVGDSSVIMNSMLRYPGNRALAAALVRYASEDDASGPRAGTLYVLANDFETVGSFGADGHASGLLGDARHATSEAIDSVRREGMPSLASYLLALAAGLGVIAWTTSRAGHPHRPLVPRFVRPASPVAQGGVAGRAAVLAAPRTSRVLAMLEMKSALEELVATRLGLDRALPPDELARGARRAGLLDEPQALELSRLLTSLGRMESAFAVGRRRPLGRLRDADVLAVAGRVRVLLEAVGQVGPWYSRPEGT